MNFTGTLDELHALTEIFIDKCYKPEKIPNTIIDMGANIGLATIWLKLNYPNTKIHAYEPNPEIFNVLKSNISNLNNVYLYNLAISDTDNEKIEFNISKRSFSSSKFPIPNSNKIYVSATTIDNAINIVNEKVDLIKIDIEGAEFSAIKISNKINEVNEIIGEIHPEKANESSANIINKLEFSHKIKYIGTNKSLFHAIKK
ncbi:MAG: SAM-dependent methyltransferase [Parcubacteria bacterium C7867-006]|nr:MAG: SAM-dependent methyltransferase [Parcubacteria bacterium C7867-006]